MKAAYPGLDQGVGKAPFLCLRLKIITLIFIALNIL